jgi:PKD domain
MFKGRYCNIIVLIAAAALTAACDKAQLLAPTQSTITISAPTRVLPSNGTTPITAAVMEQAGTPVQNGTTVRFTTTLGRVDPVEVQTTNGLAITTFFAGPNSGVAEIRANSGAASGGEGTTATNVVSITIGAAAVNTVTVRANPSSIGPNGGSVELIATVVGENGQQLEGVVVTFNADQGSLSSTTAVTSSGGEARTTLTTSQQTIVTATAGTKTSSNLTISLRAGPVITIACAPASGTGNCAAIQASTANNTAIVIFTVTKPAGSSALRTATLDFGDGTSQSLGNLAGGTLTITHTYEGPSGTTNRAYTATVLATDINGESAAVSTTVIVTPRSRQLNVTLAAGTPTVVAGVGATVALTATVTPATGGADVVQKYVWSFSDGAEIETSGNTTSHVFTENGIKSATVTVTTTDGRTASATTQFIISGI